MSERVSVCQPLIPSARQICCLCCSSGPQRLARERSRARCGADIFRDATTPGGGAPCSGSPRGAASRAGAPILAAGAPEGGRSERLGIVLRRRRLPHQARLQQSGRGLLLGVAARSDARRADLRAVDRLLDERHQRVARLSRRGAPRVLEDPAIIASDSIRYRAWERNPLVNQALVVLLYEKLRRPWGGDPGNQRLDQLRQRLLRQVDRVLHRRRARRRRTVPGSTTTSRSSTRRWAATTARASQIIEPPRRRCAPPTGRSSSTSTNRRRCSSTRSASSTPRAASATTRARRTSAPSQENLAFAPAHAALGELAAARGDTGTARRPSTRSPWNSRRRTPLMRVRYARSPAPRRQRPADAVAEARTAVSLEPYYADGYLVAGRRLATAERHHAGRHRVQEYLKRAPRTCPPRRSPPRSPASRNSHGMSPDT